MHYSRNDALYEAYKNIEQIMQKNGPHITLEETFHIPCPIPDAADAPAFHDPESPVPPTVEELTVHSVQAETMRMSLNTEQTEAYNAIIKSVLNNEGKTFFIDGPGGTGKSYVYKSVTKKLQSLELSYCACASNGINATLIGGCTVHNCLEFPWNSNSTVAPCSTPTGRQQALYRMGHASFGMKHPGPIASY